MIRVFKLLRFGFYAPFYCIRFISAIAGRCLPVPLFKALRKFAGVVISCVLGDLCNRLPAANQLHRCLLQTVFLDEQNLLGSKWYMVGPAGPRCEHVFRELYESASYAERGFLQLKVLELMLLLGRIPTVPPETSWLVSSNHRVF